MNDFERSVKRVGDCLLAFIGLIIFSPLFLICYLAVKHEDGGAAIFKQERIQNQPEKIYLARSIRLMQAPFETYDEKVQNLLGLLRIHYHHKNYSEALKIIDALEKHPNIQGYLHVRLKESLHLMRFEILVELKKNQAGRARLVLNGLAILSLSFQLV